MKLHYTAYSSIIESSRGVAIDLEPASAKKKLNQQNPVSNLG